MGRVVGRTAGAGGASPLVTSLCNPTPYTLSPNPTHQCSPSTNSPCRSTSRVRRPWAVRGRGQGEGPEESKVEDVEGMQGGERREWGGGGDLEGGRVKVKGGRKWGEVVTCAAHAAH